MSTFVDRLTSPRRRALRLKVLQVRFQPLIYLSGIVII